MSLPSYFPNPQRTQKLIDELLDRVKGLDPLAKKRLALLLDTEADLPMLDKLERSYREKVIQKLSEVTNRNAATELGNALRSQFNRNLSLQRDFLHTQVRKVLHESLEDMDNSIHLSAEHE